MYCTVVLVCVCCFMGSVYCMLYCIAMCSVLWVVCIVRDLICLNKKSLKLGRGKEKRKGREGLGDV